MNRRSILSLSAAAVFGLALACESGIAQTKAPNLRPRIMPSRTLYAYVDGADLEDIAADLETRFAAFINGRDWWMAGAAWVVNQKHRQETRTRPEDLPLWDLGLNLSLPSTESPIWFRDVEAIAEFLGMLHRECGRDFAIGIGDITTGIGGDLFYVETDLPDIARLRSVVRAALRPLWG
jgi:hypothetical protein